jgi:hypothetical protein
MPQCIKNDTLCQQPTTTAKMAALQLRLSQGAEPACPTNGGGTRAFVSFVPFVVKPGCERRAHAGVRPYKDHGQYWASSSVGWAVGANCFLM